MGSPRAAQARTTELNRRNRNLNTKVGQQQYLADQRQRFGLDAVATPDFEFANTAVRQYGRYITDFRPFEEEMLAKRNDTSIVDAVPEDVARQTQIARDANNRTLADLINIVQGVNRSSLSGLSTAAQNDVSRQNAFTQARAANKAQNRQIAGSALGTAASIGIALLAI